MYGVVGVVDVVPDISHPEQKYYHTYYLRFLCSDRRVLNANTPTLLLPLVREC